MASPGETVTYSTPTGSTSQNEEDVSDILTARIDYIDGAGGGSGNFGSGGSGGRVEDVVVDVSAISTLLIWVGGAGGDRDGDPGLGRFNGGGADGTQSAGGGGGSTEVAFPSQDTGQADAPAVAGSGAGAGGGGDNNNTGGGGARGGTGDSNGDGTPPPQGGDSTTSDGGDGEGYINTSMAEVSGGSTTTGGGSSENTNGEVQITYLDTVETRNPLTDGSPVTAVFFNALTNAFNGEGIIDGCDVTPGTGNFEVDISSGNIALGRSKVNVSSATVTHDSPDAEDRWDLITADSTGSPNITKGTAASTSGQPNAPDIPSDEVLLAPVYIRSGASEILAGDIESEFNAIVGRHAVDSLDAFSDITVGNADTRFEWHHMEQSGGVETGNFGIGTAFELPDQSTVNVTMASYVEIDTSGGLSAASSNTELAIADSSAIKQTILSGDGSTVHLDDTGTPQSSYQNTTGSAENLFIGVDNGQYGSGAGSDIEVQAVAIFRVVD